MNIAAFDLSLAATGYARNFGNSGVIPPTKLIGIPRLRYLRERVLELADDADVVVLEGYSYGAKGNAILNLAELGGVIRLALTDHNHQFVDIPPASLKLFACGKGNVGKDEMLAAAIRRLAYEGHDHNEADALWLLEMARTYYDGVVPTVALESKARAISKIKWPELAACR